MSAQQALAATSAAAPSIVLAREIRELPGEATPSVVLAGVGDIAGVLVPALDARTDR